MRCQYYVHLIIEEHKYSYMSKNLQKYFSRNFLYDSKKNKDNRQHNYIFDKNKFLEDDNNEQKIVDTHKELYNFIYDELVPQLQGLLKYDKIITQISD